MTCTAAILCGGMGTRLEKLTENEPKPLLPVGDGPFLESLIYELGRHGVREIILLAGFKASKIEKFARNSASRARFDMNIQISIEPSQAGTGGAIWHARELLKHDFLLVNGDSWFDINYLDIIETARRDSTSDAFIALRRIEDASRYGVVELTKNRVQRFLERPERAGPGLVNGGLIYCRTTIFDILSPVCSLERDILPALAEKGRLSGKEYSGFFIDIGLPRSYKDAQVSVPSNRRKPAVFFDRDGVLNVDHGHVGAKDRFDWCPGAREAIKILNDSGYLVFVITNQAGVAKGYYNEDAVLELHRYIQVTLQSIGAHIDDFRYCPHHPAAPLEQYRNICNWRKPSPGMIQDLMKHWTVDLSRSFVVGDKDTDIEAARLSGLPGFLYASGSLDEFVIECISKMQAKQGV